MRSPTSRFFCPMALLSDGWARNVAIDIGADGRIAAVASGMAPGAGERLAGPVVPALSNLHSHAFQRAMAGLAERAGPGDDSFWTWRAQMYRTVALMRPEDIEAIAAKLYVEMLKGGFSRVAEFHYLHHGAGGVVYADPAETSHRILAAAATAGIGLTHLPVFYAHSNFGGAEPGEGQRPFLHDVDGFLALLDRLAPACREAGATLGLALHSLRAAAPGEIAAILAAETTDGPIHIHVAEQEREVEDCLAWSGRRPVEWLLDEVDVNERWCAIHATHMTPGETERLAASGAVAGLCPATEANLGDGIFPATAFRAAGGRFGIGTDSHVATSVAEELRLLEYGSACAIDAATASWRGRAPRPGALCSTRRWRAGRRPAVWPRTGSALARPPISSCWTVPIPSSRPRWTGRRATPSSTAGSLPPPMWCAMSW